MLLPISELITRFPVSINYRYSSLGHSARVTTRETANVYWLHLMTFSTINRIFYIFPDLENLETSLPTTDHRLGASHSRYTPIRHGLNRTTYYIGK